MISNSFSIIKHLVKQSKFNKNQHQKTNYLAKISKNFNLIVVLNENSDSLFLKESLTKRVPIISLNYNNILLNFDFATYKIIGDFENKITRNNFFYFILCNVLKKAKRFKKNLFTSQHKFFFFK